jgi:hypothetical protein
MKIFFSLLYLSNSTLFYFTCGTGFWTQDLALSRQALFYLSHTLSPFFFPKGLVLLPELASDFNPPAYASLRLQACPIMSDLYGVLLIFFLGWPQTTISISQIAGIIGINHGTWVNLILFFWGRVSLYSPGCLWTWDAPASASQVLQSDI